MEHDLAYMMDIDLIAKWLMALGSKFIDWCQEQALFFEALLLALSFHVLMLPVLWVAGWALPWPKSPIITTIVEYDLSHWPNMAKTKKIFDLRNPKQNQ
jgi:hypothetical protein